MKITMGNELKEWLNGRAREFTFGVTENCNLKCKYCYFLNKNNKNVMSFDIAKKAIDYFLNEPNKFDEDGVIFEFMGGEPFLEIELIDEICDYIIQKLFILKHKWFYRYRFLITTNGMNYSSDKVQKFIKKHYGHLSISISIDGNKSKHDLQRIQINGKGSYDQVIKSLSLWQKQFPDMSTKATFSHDDLPLLKDSIIDLWNKGIKFVSANIVYEDVWKEGDPEIFEEQLNMLADYILEHDLWINNSVRFFEAQIGFPLTHEELNQEFCGMGNHMIAIDTKGNFYPCVRFFDIALSNNEPIVIGNITYGLDENKMKPFRFLQKKNFLDKECIECKVATGCGQCGGYSYDMSKNQTIFYRTKYNCKMHQANVRANKRFWKLFENKTGYVSPRTMLRITPTISKETYLYIITDSSTLPICNYSNYNNIRNIMDDSMVIKALEYAENNDLCPIFIGQSKHNSGLYFSFQNYNNNCDFSVPIYDNGSLIINDNINYLSKSCVLVVNRFNINDLFNNCKLLYNRFIRINFSLSDLILWDNTIIDFFVSNLMKIKEIYGDSKECNFITDIEKNNDFIDCLLNKKSLTIAPNGKFYRCPGFYYHNENFFIGDIDDNYDDLVLDFNRISCKDCQNYSCTRCVLISKHDTGNESIVSNRICYLYNKIKESLI